MEMTQQQVIDALERRNIFVNERRLTDWRRKGFLPELSERRNRLGRIERYVWTQDNIVEQAETVARLLSLNGRARRTHVVFATLWLQGYEVDQAKALAGLRVPVEDTWAKIDRRMDDREDIQLEDVISEMVFRRFLTRTGRTRRNMDRLPEVMEIIISIGYLPEYPISSGLIEQLMSWKPNTNPLLGLDDDAEERWTWFLGRVTELRDRLSLSKLCEALSSASDQDYDHARRDLLVMGECVGRVVKLITEASEATEEALQLEDLKLPVLSRVGPWLIAISLALHRAGHGEWLHKWMRWLRRTIWTYSHDQVMILHMRETYARMQAQNAQRKRIAPPPVTVMRTRRSGPPDLEA